MGEYSKIARGNFISTGAAQIIALPFQPTIVRMTNRTAYATFTATGIPWAEWDSSRVQGTAVVGHVGTGPVLQVGVVATGGITTFAQGLSLQYGPKKQIASIDKATGIFTTAAAHGFSSGDVVVFVGLYQTSTTGMPQICGMPFTIDVESSTTFVSGWNLNQSNFTNLSGSPAGAFVMKVLNPYIYQPGLNFIEDLDVSGTTLTVTTTSAHNYVVGQQVAFRIPAAYGSTELNSLPNTIVPGSPLYTYVTSVDDYNVFEVSLVPYGGAITPFNSNQPANPVSGLQFPQVLAVGDVNTGGFDFDGSQLYPSPVVTPFSDQSYKTINGPAIKGAFFNNTRQGFIIGTGNAVIGGTPDASSSLVGAASDNIYWEALFTDIGS